MHMEGACARARRPPRPRAGHVRRPRTPIGVEPPELVDIRPAWPCAARRAPEQEDDDRDTIVIASVSLASAFSAGVGAARASE